MKNVIVLSSFRRVLNEDKTVLHEASCSETIAASNLSFEDACNEAIKIFEDTKLLGNYTEVLSEPQYGRFETKVEYPDKKLLHRVIYLKDV